ncbi:hypothetical protein Pd630_LPD02055 [Rhodococcus opacus PD630]|nr:hypothetical protein Pd630_LPD02055 [Rhodococcus opacus PD630]
MGSPRLFPPVTLSVDDAAGQSGHHAGKHLCPVSESNGHRAQGGAVEN